MVSIFLLLFDMSVAASIMIAAAFVLRGVLKKAPKIFSSLLWIMVLFRLLSPVSFPSDYSLLQLTQQSVPQAAPTQQSPAASLTTNPPYQVMGNVNPLPENNNAPTATPKAIATSPRSYDATANQIGAVIWFLGFFLMLSYSAIQLLRFHKGLKDVVWVEKNIYEGVAISSPFVWGILRPKIYVPIHLPQDSRSYIICHEQTHIRRLDHCLKPLFYLALCLHWFNPLVWAAFACMSCDIELACDEAVLKTYGESAKKDYCHSLLAFTVHKKTWIGTLAFGEGHTNRRIKNILQYKRPPFWFAIIALVVLSITAVTLLTDPLKKEPDLSLANIEQFANQFMQLESMDRNLPNIINLGDPSVTSAGLDSDTETELQNFVEPFATGFNEPRSYGYMRTKGATRLAATWFANQILQYDALYHEPYRKLTPNSVPDLAEPDMTIYPYLDNDYRMELFKQADHVIAKISIDKNAYYYKMPLHFYDTLAMRNPITTGFSPEEAIAPIFDGKKTSLQSVQDFPQAVDVRVVNSICSYYLYEKNGKYYAELPYQFIHELTQEMYEAAYALSSSPNHITDSDVTENINAILAQYPEAGFDYQNTDAYQNILKMGDTALEPLLAAFRNGDAEGLRGTVILSLCKDIFGPRSNITDESLSPTEWYERLSVRNRITLNPFHYEGDNWIEALVYEAELQKIAENSRIEDGELVIVAPHIFGSYEESDSLKIFVTTYSTRYILYDTVLMQNGGAIVPAALTFVKDANGSYRLSAYEQAKDGSENLTSIRAYCTMPITGTVIPELADEIIQYRTDPELVQLERDNLVRHLTEQGLLGITLQLRHNAPEAEWIPLT